MSRSHHYKKKGNEPPEMDVTTFMNLMVVLVPFLLITAVFSRITILELHLPTGGGGASNKPQVSVEIIVRKDVLELGNGQGVVARILNTEGKYDIKKLAEYLVKVKGNYPDKTDATILVEPDIEYENIVRVMDAVRIIEMAQEGRQEVQRVELFPDLSIGDAP